MHVSIDEEDAAERQMETYLMLAELIFDGKLTMMTMIPRSRRTLLTTNLSKVQTNLSNVQKINKLTDDRPSEMSIV